MTFQPPSPDALPNDHTGDHADDRPVVREVDLGTARLLPDVDRPGGWLLTMDDTPQSYVDLTDPQYLEFEYVQRLAHVADLCADEGAPLDVVHLGGGALTLPRYLAATRPGSRQQVAELDAGLIALVREVLPWGRGAEGPEPAVHAADARAFLASCPPDSADLLVADVFGGHTIPAALTSVEFAGMVARVLRADGVYAANLADGAPLDFLRGQIATVRTVLPELALIAEPSVLRGRRYGNVVLVASSRPLPVAGLTRRAAGDPFPARVVAGEEAAALAARVRPVTDATAVPSPPPPDGAFSV
ncbi:spermidine synthase [Streptacidiphilus fuscans]|uniref:Fused MFS/spermidine synthase n=1 Tax=Streptacidiphilus fuscans TaxID=2789292 RepID=A0A931B5U9_9ACTN|nr:fused MFS/spermidine synthase [Streptacidiphilus fuscans]MBF9069997.1 fused MFS/spermidine synthase [Streptacidiphilus fuscans]